MEYEIPYNELKMVGISKKMMDDMPLSFKKQLLDGELTPLISLKRDMGNNTILNMPFKLMIQNSSDGSQQLVVYPMNKEMKNSVNLSESNFHALGAGDILHVNGRYLQRDPETNCVIEKTDRQLDFDRKIAELEKVKDIELGVQQKTQLKEGKPVELDVGGEKVTVGLDLRDKEHFKTLKGDMEEWKRQKEIEYDIIHPEYVGIVQTDENRWEQQMIKKEGLNSQTLKAKPAQTRSSGLSR